MSAGDPLVPHASAIVGATPRGAVRTLSLSVRDSIGRLKDQGARFVLLALSGGADSMAMAVATIDVAQRHGLAVHSLTVDHGVRSESSEEAQWVARLATDLGAQAATRRIQMPPTGGPEGSARQGRREALMDEAVRLLGQYGGDFAPILVGHTMDDQAETVLLRLARGSGVSSLKAMAPLRAEGQVMWVRPVLNLRRSLLRAALAEAKVPWVDDVTNAAQGPWRSADGSPLRRAAVRDYALPTLSQALGVDVVPSLARTALLAADDEAALAQWADTAYRAAGVEGQPERLIVSEIMELPVAVLRRVLRHHLLTHGARGGDLGSTHVEKVLELVTKWHGQGPVNVPGVSVQRLGKGKDAHICVFSLPAGQAHSAGNG